MLTVALDTEEKLARKNLEGPGRPAHSITQLTETEPAPMQSLIDRQPPAQLGRCLDFLRHRLYVEVTKAR